MELTDLERNEIQNLLHGYDCEYIPHLKEATNKIFNYVQELVGQLEPLVKQKIAERQVQKTINELKDWDLFAKLDKRLQDDIIDEISISTLTTEELSNFSE